MGKYSFKLGKELGVLPLKFISKYSTKELEELIKEANDLLYFFSTLFITFEAKLFIQEKLIEIGTRLKDINWPIAKGKRKEEFREKLLEIYSKVLRYSVTNDSAYTRSIIDSMNSYLVSSFIYDKKTNGINEEMVFKWLKKIKLFSEVYAVKENLLSVQKECLDFWKISKDKMLYN